MVVAVLQTVVEVVFTVVRSERVWLVLVVVTRVLVVVFVEVILEVLVALGRRKEVRRIVYTPVFWVVVR